MKVVFITRSTLHSVKGGDTIQVMETAAQLIKRGISVDVKKTHEKIDYGRYDLLHFFNIIRPADILYHIYRCDKPFVLSAIFIDYSEYEKRCRKGITGSLFRFLSANQIEYLKTMARFLTGTDKLMTASYAWKGQNACIKEILHRASLILFNSDLECKRLEQRYKFSARSITVHNGINQDLFRLDDKEKKDERLILCVARIEGIKNQLNLIRALNHSKYQLLIIGSPSPGHTAYYKTCRAEAAPNVQFIEHLTQAELVFYYRKAKVHVLPSWFENCGLSSLEAAVMGCNLVITEKGYTREYYEDHAFYCEPGSTASIRKAVDDAALAVYPSALQKKILTSYTWSQTAGHIAEAYHQISSVYEYSHRHIGYKRNTQPLRGV